MGHLPVAAGFPVDAELPVERRRDSVLDEAGEVREGPRRPGGLRGTPGLHRVQPGDDPEIRKECGSNLGANFDPSHFFWQGIDPVHAVRELGGKAIFHVHAKDLRVEPINALKNGVLDTKHYSDERTARGSAMA